MRTNPIKLEVFKNRYCSIAEEMGVALQRTAYSPNIKERRDFSCALFDSHGGMIAQAAHIPVHLGSMPMSVVQALAAVPMGAGDMVILNNPFQGGTHLPDVTLVAPFYSGGDKPAFYVANRAHHADIGGMAAGSMPVSTSLFQEGLIIPPLKLVEAGRLDEKLLQLIISNVRTAEEREGDFTAQYMANLTGIRRLGEMAERYGLWEMGHFATALMDYGEELVRKAIGRIPDGTYFFEDFLDDDGWGEEKIPLRVVITVDNDELTVDFTASAHQVQGSVNAVRSITVSCVLYVFRCLLGEDIPANAGCLRPIKVVTRRGSILDASYPAAVAGGNVETSQRIVDILLGALAEALPGEIPAASQGTMNNITIGGSDPNNGNPFTYYETIGGGAGASPGADGADGIHTHMTNTLNTPIEAMEFSYPLVVTEYSLRKDSGGRGKFNGGEGLVREIKLMAPGEVTVLSERRKFQPYGLAGGKPAQCGCNEVIKGGKKERRPGKFTESLQPGDIIRIRTPGGGGFGNPPCK